MKIRFTALAEQDLRSLFAYISMDNPQAAKNVLDLIERTIKGLGQYPLLGHEGRKEGTRELIIPHTSYCVVYKIVDDIIYIITILHEARRWN